MGVQRKIGEMKNEKRNDMGVGVYGCMPSDGWWGYPRKRLERKGLYLN
jgi:hypothetical protein